MRRTKLVVAATATIVAMLVAFAAPALADDRRDNDHFFSHDFEQEAESGDVDQTFDVSQTGDNSNQTVGIQGVANTGNAQNQIGISQFESDADDFEFEDVGSSIEVSPTNTTSSNQEVNQAASASFMPKPCPRGWTRIDFFYRGGWTYVCEIPMTFIPG